MGIRQAIMRGGINVPCWLLDLKSVHSWRKISSHIFRFPIRGKLTGPCIVGYNHRRSMEKECIDALCKANALRHKCLHVESQSNGHLASTDAFSLARSTCYTR
eukprot:1134250-Pelagomonas_calceolata.AAC.12